MTSRFTFAGIAFTTGAAAMLMVSGCGNSTPAASPTAGTSSTTATASSGTIAPGDLDAAKIKMMCQELLPVIQQMNKDRSGNAPSSADVITQALSEMPATTAHDKADAQAAAQKALTGKCD